jgi:hypothetical protein
MEDFQILTIYSEDSPIIESNKSHNKGADIEDNQEAITC